jgi:hypothetical protein
VYELLGIDIESVRAERLHWNPTESRLGAETRYLFGSSSSSEHGHGTSEFTLDCHVNRLRIVDLIPLQA